MKFQSTHIHGKGRGKKLGFPTINLTIPPAFSLEDGVYAAWVTIGEKRYKGALHYGPIPAFGEKEKSLEVFLLDGGDDLPLEIKEEITIEIVQRLRGILSFPSSEELVTQIRIDVTATKEILR